MKRNCKNNPLFFLLISKILYFLILNFFNDFFFHSKIQKFKRILKNFSFYNEFAEKNFIFITILLKIDLRLLLSIVLSHFLQKIKKINKPIYIYKIFHISQEGCMVESISRVCNQCVCSRCLNM